MEPNKRVQDGIKRHWLCESCEVRLSKWEDKFARNIFHPYVQDGGSRLRYGPWLVQFGISVVWRVLRLYQDEYGLKGYPDEDLPRVAAAERKWREYLLGQHRHPGEFPLHMLPVDGVQRASFSLPPTINRYYLRTFDTDVAHGRSIAFVYVKVPRFFFLGFTRLDHSAQWVGTKVHATEGLIEPRKYVMPKSFAEYVNERAERMHKIHASMSARQRERINEIFVANADEFIGSDLFRAMERDIELFGDAAFFKEPPLR